MRASVRAPLVCEVFRFAELELVLAGSGLAWAALAGVADDMQHPSPIHPYPTHTYTHNPHTLTHITNTHIHIQT